jgi:serine/threonine protein kinase
MVTDTSEWTGTTLCEGRYRVLKKLGEGGMAHVYLARDDKLERDVVIKVPRSNLIHDGSFSGRFTREVRSLAKLAHPHVVPLIDIGQHDGVPFAVMHYLTGGSLRDRQPRDAEGKPKPMPVESLHAWLPPIAQALDFVHKNKYVHRDIKPENILFDDEGQVFISDLGIVKALTEQQDPDKRTVFTGAGMVLGTPHYMAPELILGETVDGRVDQYALAVTLYEMLAGQYPFNGASAPAIFVQQTTKPPPPLREVAPHVPASIAAAIDKALSKTPAERFATCLEFVQTAIGIGSGAHIVPSTVMEQRIAKEPVLATLLEPAAQRKDTPSDLKNPTALATGPASWQKPAAAPAGRSKQPMLVLGIGAAVVAAAVGVAIFLLTRGGNAADLTLAKVPALSLLPGDKQSVKVEIQRQRLDGDVTCWLDGLPEGVKADRIVLPTGKSEGTIELAISADAPPQKATANLKAKGQNIETSVPVDIAITAPLASLRILPMAPKTLKAGDIIRMFVSIERKNCVGPVALALDGLPSGVTWHRPSFSAPVIPADQTDYPLELKAAANAAGAERVKLTLTGRLKGIEGTGDLELTVVSAPPPPTPPTEVKPPPTVVENPPMPPKTNVTKVDPPQPPTIPGELILVNMLHVSLEPGERRTVWVQIERKDCDGPVSIALDGMPTAVALAPQTLETIPATRLALPFEFVADAAAPPSTNKLRVTAALGELRAFTYFNLNVLKKSPPPINAAAILWQKTDKLAATDPLDTVVAKSRAKSYSVPLIAGKTYTIDMTSTDFDSYLRIEKARGESLAVDDDSGGGLNARIVFTPTMGGLHTIIATSFNAGAEGTFTLSIR